MPVDKKMLAMLDPSHPDHVEYVNLVTEVEQDYRQRTQSQWEKMMDYWDLYLAEQTDPRDQIDELWRSKIFVPLPSSNTITKASELTNIVANSDPVWQVAASTEDKRKLQDSKPIERLLDWSLRMNNLRRLLFKLFTSRSVQGITFLKLTFKTVRHDVMHYIRPGDEEKFQRAIQEATMAGAVPPPDPYNQTKEFEEWRKLVNTAGTFGRVPEIPQDGIRAVTTYQGPVLEQVAPWDVRIDPTIDSLEKQEFVIHRYVRSKKWVLERSDDSMGSAKPFYLPAVKQALEQSAGEMVQEWDQELTRTLGFDHADLASRQGEDWVEIMEVWSPNEKYKFGVVLNQKAIINKNPFEFPTLNATPNIFGIRNLPIQGHYYGLSDYKQPFELFKELNQFRRLRMDGATLTVMPAFIKQAGLTLPSNMRGIRPGGFITLPNLNGIKPLFDHNLPSEAYREPQEIKQEIEDATGISGYTKGKEATINRVTGVEVQGRAAQTQMRFKVDTGVIEDDLSRLPNCILSMWHQLGDPTIRIAVSGGDPLAEISKSDLAQWLDTDFVLRGPTKALDPDMLVQQILNATQNYQDVMLPNERRAAYRFILETLDIRGHSKMVSAEGDQMFSQAGQAQVGAQTATDQTTQQQAQAQQQPSPNQPPPQQ